MAGWVDLLYESETCLLLLTSPIPQQLLLVSASSVLSFVPSLYSCYQFLVLSSWLFNWVGDGEVTVLFSFNTKGASNIWKQLNGIFWWMNESIYFRCSSLIRTHSPVFPCSCWLDFIIIIFFEEEIKLITWKTNSARASKPLWTGYERSLFFL